MPTTKDTRTDVEFNQIRKMIREELYKRFGGVSAFLKSESGEKFGGLKSKSYFFDTGSANFEVISGVCKFLGLGELTRKVVVSRKYYYKLKK